MVASILSGVLILQISPESGLDWKKSVEAWSFYGLLGVCVVMYFYNRAVYRHERAIHQFLDSDYCIAYMRSKCLPEAADRYRELIRSGDGGELEQAMDELMRILK